VNRLIIVDCSYIAHRTKYALKGLSVEEINTGVIFGFLNSLLLLSEKFSPCTFAFAWDSRNSIRKEIFSGYKVRDNGDTSEEEKQILVSLRSQIPILRKYVLPSIGFRNIFAQSGYEADDIIANLTASYCMTHDCIVISRDHDLYQLLDMCCMYDPDSKRLYTLSDFVSQYDINPLQWVDVKCLSGCSSDTVPGIKGVGEKTAIKYLKNQLSTKTKTYDNIVSVEGRKRYDENMELVKLPLNGTKNCVIDEDEIFKLTDFIEICNEFRFTSFLKEERLNRWKRHFSMI
jgi:DNA polymerase-1